MKRKPASGVRRQAKRHAIKHNPKSRIKRKPLQDTIGANIRKARNSKGITQLALAHAIGYTGDDAGAYISRVESDTQAPRIDTLLRIADALQVTVCSLLAS